MIRAESLAARAAPIGTAPASFELGPGVHAMLGAREDGVSLLLATLAGRIRPRSGSIRVLGNAPDAVRPAVAYVPMDATLPDALRVDETLAVAASIRGEPATDATKRLAVLGIAPLASRAVRTLTLAEVRAVAMCEALTGAAKVLVFEEPYVAIDPRAAALLASQLRDRASGGACVVLGTASVRDAFELADRVMIFDRGVLVRSATAEDARMMSTAGPAQLEISVSDARALLGELAAEKAVTSFESRPESITVSGSDMVELAAAVARAVGRAGVDVAWLRAGLPKVEELRAASAAEAEVAYQTALARAKAIRASSPVNPLTARASAPLRPRDPSP